MEELDEYLLKRLFLVNAQHKLLLFSLKKDKLDLSPKKAEFTLYILVQILESILFLIKDSRWSKYFLHYFVEPYLQFTNRKYNF